MFAEDDFHARGWQAIPNFMASDGLPEALLPSTLVREIESHPEASGYSGWGIRNTLFSLILSLRPKRVLEIGSHIGAASVVMGAALRANGFGRLDCLEPSDTYFPILQSFIQKARLHEYVKPHKALSTDFWTSGIADEDYQLIYLDANHSYSHVRFDLDLCYEILVDNGIVVLDDTSAERSPKLCTEGRGGPRQALIDFTKEKDDIQTMFFEYPLWLNPMGMAMFCKQNVV